MEVFALEAEAEEPCPVYPFSVLLFIFLERRQEICRDFIRRGKIKRNKQIQGKSLAY
jgi:hypothetical protein